MHLSRYMFLLNENLNIMLGHEIGILHHTYSVFKEVRWTAGRQRERLSNLCKEVATNLCKDVQRSAKKWLCSKKSVKSCKAVVVFNKRCNQAETLCPPRRRGGRGIVRAGQIYLPLPWSLQCWTLLCLWLCWQRYIFPLDSRTWTWTSDRGIVWAG